LDAVYRFRRKRAREARSHSSKTQRQRFSALLTLLLFAGLLGLAASAIAGFVVFRTYAADVKPAQEVIAEKSIGSSFVYDRTGGTQLYRFVDKLEGLKDPKPLTEISPYLIAATIATEDASFYHNPGVNFRGLVRAAWENLTPFGPGFLAGSGGSSITQQLARNIYIDPSERFDRKIQRKLKETVIALELKQKYDDNQILEWYLNQISYGDVYGAQAAAVRYFGKSAKDLTLAEAALLAGLPQAPGLYTPAIPENRERAKARQMEVLDLMIKHLDEINKIPDPKDPSKPLLHLTAEDINAARQEPLNYVEATLDIKAPHFVFYVEDQVKKMCARGLFDPPGGLPCNKVVERGGLRITTSLDLGLQQIAEQTVEEQIAANEERYGGHDGSLVAIRPGTGEILAYVGSRNYFRADIAGEVDIARSLQSHGSTMKVFTYLTAFEKGWVPSTFVQDEPLYLDVGGQKKQVNNWNFSHMGNITIRKALSESVNTAAVRTVMEVGVDDMRNTAHRLGITDLRQSDCGPTITLGACEVQLLDMTFAFATLANNGVMRGRPTVEDLPEGYRELDPVAVLKIEDSFGNVLYQYSAPEERQVFDPAYVYMITDILSKEAINWSRLTIDRPAATKTGTSEEFRDGVVLGYTPDLAVGVWMGNADNTPMAPGTFSSAGSGPMWKRFTQAALEYLQLPPRPFEVPPTIVTVDCGGRKEVFKAGERPSKPGACRAPAVAPTPVPGNTPEPTPKPPVFPVRTGSPAPSPTPEASESPVATETPRPGPPGGSTPTVYYYTVKEGDTLGNIAAKFGVSVEAIRELNDLKPGDSVYPGQILMIPIRG